MLDGGGVEFAVGAEDEEAEGAIDLDQQGFAANAQFLVAGAGGIFRSAGGFVVDFAEDDVFGGQQGTDLVEQHFV